MVSTGIPLDSAAIISTVLEGILYGFLVLLFVGTIWASTRTYKRDINRLIALVAILLLILSTAHMVIDIIRLENGFVKYRDTFPGGPAAFFQDISQPTFLSKNILYAFQTMLGDGVLIYRCYVVWQSVWVIVLPSLLWCSASAAGFIAPYYASKSTGGDVYTNQSGQWVAVLFALTLATNLITSGLLAYRIWTIESKVSAIRATNGTLMPIVRVLVDAAIVYSTVLFVMLICFLCSNNAQFIIQDMTMPIIPIAFYMVFIRITLRNTTHSYLSMVCGVENNERERNLRQYPTKPLQYHISQWAHTDSTSYGVGNQDRALTCKAGPTEGASCNV
ncbi:hypothetical protein EDB19DRAFT_1897124 [Suillus lakei]|nr:hypothetical protein EDB19DRAFT_1897124 [Suillus lakei]